jgi:hypothetical protein
MYYRQRKVPVFTRVVFDPTNHEHRLDYAKFLKYNTWVNGCNYFLEDPYSDIPSMINAKIVEDSLRSLIRGIA